MVISGIVWYTVEWFCFPPMPFLVFFPSPGHHHFWVVFCSPSPQMQTGRHPAHNGCPKKVPWIQPHQTPVLASEEKVPYGYQKRFNRGPECNIPGSARNSAKKMGFQFLGFLSETPANHGIFFSRKTRKTNWCRISAINSMYVCI